MEINGYIREAEKCLHPQIIPSDVNLLVYSYYDPWFKLKSMPQPLVNIYPNPMYYHSSINNKNYFIVCPHFMNSTSIYKYDISNDDWQILTKYPDGFLPGCHGALIDAINEDLYIFYGSSGLFGKYNLKFNKWEIHDNPEQYNSIQALNPLYTLTPPPMNEVHAIGIICKVFEDKINYVHQKYTSAQGKFIQISNQMKNAGYLPSYKGQLVKVNIGGKYIYFVLGGSDAKWDYLDQIYYSESLDENCEWKLFVAKLPRKSSVRAVVYGQLLIVRIWNDQKKVIEICCLEIENCIDNNDNKWLKCDISPPEKSQWADINIVGDKYLCFMEFGEEQMHCKVHLSHVLPMDLYLKYSN